MAIILFGHLIIFHFGKFIKKIFTIDLEDILLSFLLFGFFGCDFVPFFDISWKTYLIIIAVWHVISSVFESVEVGNKNNEDR